MEIADAMRKEFSTAKRCWAGIIFLQALLLLGAIYAIFSASGTLLLVIGLGSLLIPVITFWLKEIAGFHYGLGERIRRLLVLQDGLGRMPSAKELLEVCSDCTSLPSLDPQPLGKYYDSPLPQGPQRLAHIIEESAFYTRKLAAVSALFCAGLTAIGIIFTFGLLWYELQTISPATATIALSRNIGTSEQFAKLLSVLLVFFAAGTFATLWRSYKSLSESARRAFEKCDLWRQDANAELLGVFTTVETYDCALAKGPPISRVIYWLYRKRLHQAWTEFMSTS